MKTKKKVSGTELIKLIRDRAQKIEDHRKVAEFPLDDVIMAAFAMFKFKMPSLLSYDKLRGTKQGDNLQNLFRIQKIPSDTQTRAVLDKVPYHDLFPIFKSINSLLGKQKILNEFLFEIPGEGDFNLVALDGTGFFSSTNIKCPGCLTKSLTRKELQKLENYDPEDEDMEDPQVHRFHHQLLGAAIVSPHIKQVIPLCPEPILYQDGETKNDCERAAAKRWVMRYRDFHPRLKTILLVDALFPHAPFLRQLQEQDLNYIASVRNGSHKFLFECIEKRDDDVVHIEKKSIGDKVKKTRTRTYRFLNNLPLNKANTDIGVSMLDFTEVIEWEGKRGYEKKKVHFTWITNFTITKENAPSIARAGRSRWSIENEAFNTLKNQGYNLEHNYGHGKENLSTNFALLMMLAFATDQIEELCCGYFQKCRERFHTKAMLWTRFWAAWLYKNFSDWTSLVHHCAVHEPPELNTS